MTKEEFRMKWLREEDRKKKFPIFNLKEHTKKTFEVLLWKGGVTEWTQLKRFLKLEDAMEFAKTYAYEHQEHTKVVERHIEYFGYNGNRAA